MFTMNSRISAYRLSSRLRGESSPAALLASSKPIPRQIADQLVQLDSCIHEHALTGLAVAFSIGVLLGWMIKRR
jgi:hypothetical protein